MIGESVKKSDWKTLEMPEENTMLLLQEYFDKEIISILQQDFKPIEMEDKWFSYAESGKLYLHRSWTGYCIYIVELNVGDTHEVVVNRNVEQYTNMDDNQDIERLQDLLYYLSRGKYKRYKPL